MNITERIKNLKSDLSCKDFEGPGTLMDIEAVACECIIKGRKFEGTNLLTVYGRLLGVPRNKKDEWLTDLKWRMEDAERVLA